MTRTKVSGRMPKTLADLKQIEEAEFEDYATTIINTETERYCALLDLHGSKPETRALLSAILEVRHAPDDKAKQFTAISLCLAELLENNFLPDALRAGITDGIIAAVNATDFGGFDSPEILRTGALLPVLDALLQRELPERHSAGEAAS